MGGSAAIVHLAWHTLLGGGIAAALGLTVPFGIRALFTRDLAPEYLKTPILLAGALGVYAAGEAIQPETGVLKDQFYGIAALGWRGSTVHWHRWRQAYYSLALFGVVLANIEVTGLQELRRFKESLTVFLVSGAVHPADRQYRSEDGRDAQLADRGDHPGHSVCRTSVGDLAGNDRSESQLA